MKRLIKIIALRRFAEMLLLCVVLSSVITALYTFAIIPSTQITLTVGLIVGALLFYIPNVKTLRDCFFDLRSYGTYYAANFLSCAAFALVNLLARFLVPNAVYTWMFSITKFLRYTGVGLGAGKSSILFHVIMFWIVIVAPVGMNWVFDIETDTQDDE